MLLKYCLTNQHNGSVSIEYVFFKINKLKKLFKGICPFVDGC